MAKFQDKVVLITGSSDGIGKGGALAFAREGARVVLHGRSVQKLEKFSAELLAEGIPAERFFWLAGDIADQTFCARLVDETISRFGQLDILINNAAILRAPGEESETLANFDAIMAINLRAVVVMTRLCVPHLARTKGTVINVSSLAGFLPVTGAPFYCMVKLALDQYTKQAAIQYGKQGIRVNSLNPGPILTPMLDQVGGEQGSTMRKWVRQTTLLERFGDVAEMGEALKFLASGASYCTGTLLLADGGHFLRLTPGKPPSD